MPRERCKQCNASQPQGWLLNCAACGWPLSWNRLQALRQTEVTVEVFGSRREVEGVLQLRDEMARFGGEHVPPEVGGSGYSRGGAE